MRVNEKNLKILTQTLPFYKGVIEDDKDPLESQRYRVRIIGIDDETIPTETLPWATSLDFSLFSGMGFTSFIKKGAYVLVHLFQNDRNQPIIIGVLKGVNNQNEELQSFKDPTGQYPLNDYKNQPDTNNKSKGEKYLKNQVFETESGHYMEFDDSNGDERIHIFHRTGTEVLIDKEGTVTINVVKDRNLNVKENQTSIIDKNDTTHIKENKNLTVDKDNTTNIKGNNTISIDKDCNITIKGECNITVTGNANIKASNINLN
ncbi:putative baseplate hub subunit and tail lysozyme [Campylobacter phage F370]|nr:putative baseplate hub subunit and tail lysozyme [Campylobacter phage F370]QPX65234.1 putative baseplate hub subunit and tail lysozyme [Campylobacter phage F371]